MSESGASVFSCWKTTITKMSAMRYEICMRYCFQAASCHIQYLNRYKTGLTVYAGFLKDTKSSSPMGSNCWEERKEMKRYTSTRTHIYTNTHSKIFQSI